MGLAQPPGVTLVGSVLWGQHSPGVSTALGSAQPPWGQHSPGVSPGGSAQPWGQSQKRSGRRFLGVPPSGLQGCSLGIPPIIPWWGEAWGTPCDTPVPMGPLPCPPCDTPVPVGPLPCPPCPLCPLSPNTDQSRSRPAAVASPCRASALSRSPRAVPRKKRHLRKSGGRRCSPQPRAIPAEGTGGGWHRD